MENQINRDVTENSSELIPAGSEQNTQPSLNDYHSMDTPVTFRRRSSRSSCRSAQSFSRGFGLIVGALGVLFLLYISYYCIWIYTPKANPHTEPELMLMMLGKSGAGKSATGNTILGQDAFKAEVSPVTITKSCQKRTKEVSRRKITVIDTPPITDMLSPGQKSACVQKAFPGLHAILLVIRVGRFTEEDKMTVRWIEDNLGEEALLFTMVLFTGGDLLEGKPVEKFLNKSVELQKLLYLCGSRYHIMNNRETQNVDQVSKLLNKIDRMTHNNKAVFNISTISQKWRNKGIHLRTEDEEKCKERVREIREEMTRKRKMEVREVREEEMWKRISCENKIRKTGGPFSCLCEKCCFAE